MVRTSLAGAGASACGGSLGSPGRVWLLATVGVLGLITLTSGWAGVILDQPHVASQGPTFSEPRLGAARGNSTEPLASGDSPLAASTSMHPISSGTEWRPTGTSYTFETTNRSLVQGDHSPSTPGWFTGGTYDADTGEVWFGDSQGSSIFALNGTSGNETRSFAIATAASQENLSGAISEPAALAFDPIDHVMAAAAIAADTLTLLNSTTLQVEHVLNLSTESIVFDPVSHLLYIGDESDRNVTVVDPATGSVVKLIPVQGTANAVAFNPVAGQVLDLVASAYDSTTGKTVGWLDSINGSSLKVETEIENVSLAGASDLVVDNDNDQIFILNPGGDLFVYNGTSLAPVAKLLTGAEDDGEIAVDPLTDEVYASCTATGIAIVFGSNDTVEPHGVRAVGGGLLTSLVFDPATGIMFAGNPEQGSIEAINSATNTPIGRTSATGESFVQAVYDQDNGLVYAAAYTWNFSGVAVFDPTPEPRQVAAIATGGSPTGVAYDSSDHRLFVTNEGNGTVSVIDTRNDSVVNRSVPVGLDPYGVAFDPANGEVYVADEANDTVSVLNATTLLPAHRPIAVGSEPFGVTVDPSANQAWVTNLGSGNVTVINGSDNQVETLGIPVGAFPQGTLYDPTSGLVYVAVTGANRVVEIDPATEEVANSTVVPGGPAQLAEDASDGLVFSANANGNTVAVLDSATGALIGREVSVSPGPEGIAFVPVSKQIEVFSVESPAMNVLANSPNITSLTLRGAEVGLSPTLRVNVANGTLPYRFEWAGLPANCPSSNATEVECPVQEGTGTYDTVAKVTDSQGYNWSQSLAWAVAPELGVANATASPITVDLNTSTTIGATAMGGVDAPNASFSYEGLPNGCASANTSRLECTPRSLGLYPITVLVTDAAGGSATALVGLDVVASPAVIAAYATPASLDVNGTTELVAVVMGGVAPYSYNWSGLPLGCPSGNASSIPCSPSTPGTYSVRVGVSDSLGERAVGSFSVFVSPPKSPAPPPVTVSAFVAVPSELALGGNVTFVAVVSGGVPPYSFAYVGLPSGCPAPSADTLTCRPTASGTYGVGVFVSDVSGGMSAANVTVTISAAERGSAPPSGLSGWWVAPLVGGAAGVAGGALTSMAILARRRSSSVSPGVPREPSPPGE